jgi:exonuclease III
MTDRLISLRKTPLIVLGNLNVTPINSDVDKTDDLALSDISLCKPFERKTFSDIL